MADLSRKIQGSARLSPDGKYRYWLCREFGPGPTATFIMLNPSTADAEADDPTIRKCLGFCDRWACGSLQVINLFAVRAGSPRAMMRAADPIGPGNKRAFEDAMANVQDDDQDTPGLIVCAWGVHGGFMGRDLEVMRWLDARLRIKPMCLGLTKEGHPKHPLYVPYSARLVPCECRRFANPAGWRAIRGPVRIHGSEWNGHRSANHP